MPTPDPSWPPHILYMAEYAAEALNTAQLLGLIAVFLLAVIAVVVAVRR